MNTALGRVCLLSLFEPGQLVLQANEVKVKQVR
jgi:hypothetical protein